jgi:hypothetical protein
MRWIAPSKERPAAAAPGQPQIRDVPAPAGGEDDVIKRIVLYVPTEIVAVFTMLLTAAVGLKVEDAQRPLVGLGLILFFFIITIAYIIRSAPAGSVRNSHLLVSPLAFLAWAYPISSSILGGWFYPVVAFFLQAGVLAMSIFIKP